MKNGFLSSKNTSDTLFCFSPPVMLATFIIEFSLAAYTFIRFHTTKFSRLAIATLIFLGLFQIAEYQICSGVDPVFWSRIGFVAITLLPPLGIHLISLITGKYHYTRFAYSLAVLYSFIFLFVPRAITGTVCGGNYVIFNTAQDLSWTYGIYYSGLLLLGLWEIIEEMRVGNKNNFSLLAWLAVGYCSFMVPMGIVYSLSPAARHAIPSIMCGFAVTLAVLLSMIIVPKYHSKYAGN